MAPVGPSMLSLQVLSSHSLSEPLMPLFLNGTTHQWQDTDVKTSMGISGQKAA